MSEGESERIQLLTDTVLALADRLDNTEGFLIEVAADLVADDEKGHMRFCARHFQRRSS